MPVMVLPSLLSAFVIIAKRGEFPGLRASVAAFRRSLAAPARGASAHRGLWARERHEYDPQRTCRVARGAPVRSAGCCGAGGSQARDATPRSRVAAVASP